MADAPSTSASTFAATSPRHLAGPMLATLCVVAAACGLVAAETPAPQTKPAQAVPSQTPNVAQTPADASPAVDRRQIRSLILKLGAAEFRDRERASRAVLQLGQSAADELAEVARTSNDREIRQRAERLLSVLQRQRRTELLAQFLQPQATSQVNWAERLPMWAGFARQYGDDMVARRVYAQMLEHEWSLLEAVQRSAVAANAADEVADAADDDDSIPTLAAVLARRVAQLSRLHGGLRSRPAGTLLSLIFLATEFPTEFNQDGQIYMFWGHPQIRSLVTVMPSPNQRNERTLVRQLCGDWLVAASRDSHLDISTCLRTATMYRLNDHAVKLAVRVLRDRQARPTVRSVALQAAVQCPQPELIALVEAALDDTTVISTPGNLEQQIRDVALVTMMQLRGYPVSKIGVKQLPGARSPAVIDFSSVGFANEEQREQARQTYYRLERERKQRAAERSPR